MNPSGDSISSRIPVLLRAIYGEESSGEIGKDLQDRLARHAALATETRALSERDVVLITYADQVRTEAETPLKTLASFCANHLAGVVSAVHVLPFFPWSSDDGFSVKDYYRVAPEYGSWEDVAALGREFDLMFDAVFNHLSAQGDWFQRFLRDDPEYRDFFITVKGNPDLSGVVRPRALPLLTEFATAHGPENVWTTFSADQVDVNAGNPRVLFALLDVLFFYAQHGARFIRLDAIAYLWKQVGTPCIHLPQTHAVVQLMRAVLDVVAPGVRLITETNVPHADNISYFGDGTNEAQLVYNFALPPLVLNALLRGDSTYLARWVVALRTPSRQTAFFNFLASHDGIGLNPARGILPPEEIDFLVEQCERHGGFISYKQNPDGSRSPYEMNIVFFDALNDPAGGEPIEIQIDRFMAAQSIMLALAGVPGIYFHSLFGSRNDRDSALQSGINRRINRQKLELSALESELNESGSLRARIFSRYKMLLNARADQAAFNPQAEQVVLESDPGVFALLRVAEDGTGWVLCLHNVSGRPVILAVAAGATTATEWMELLTGDSYPVSANGIASLILRPYATLWIAASGPRPVGIEVEE